MAGAPRLVGKRPNDWRVLFARYRDAAASHITRYLTGPEGGVLAAMATGRSELIAADLRADYARSGLSHLLAVSGLHLTVFAGLFDALLSIVRCGRRMRAAAGLTAVTDLHRETVRRVNAPAQARAAEAIQSALTDEERAVYKRGRNAKVNSVPQHADVAQYHAATGLETLFGWLYLLGRTQRLRELFGKITEVL